MNELGAQIKQARTEMGLTQAQLAELLHVTRQTISNWENSHSIPDYVMLGQLAKVLQLDGLVLPMEPSAAEQPSEPEKPRRFRIPQPKHKTILGLGITLAVLLLGVIMAVHGLSPSEKSRYTVEWFSQPVTAEEGKAFVRTYSLEYPIKARQHRPEATPIYQFGVFMKEENGIGCTIHDITLVYFSGKKARFIDSFAQKDFIYLSLGSPYIGANQYRSISINFPAEKETGIGFWISGIDDHGQAFESRYYLPLVKE